MRKVVLFLALISSIMAFGQASDPVIMTINGVPVPRSEFEYSYNKNNGADVIDKKSVDEYVDLFINYKLKVAAALDAHYDTLSSFKQEYTMYRDQQVRPTMATDADVLMEAKKVYDRAKEQIGPRGLILPAHILIRVSTKATQAEQDKAKLRIDSVYNALRGGADFAELAKKVSDDKQTAVNGGQLPYWIGPNQSIKEFEDAAYALQKDEMSQPVLSPVGWHVILMKDRKQLEPFDSLKAQIVKNIEQQGVRDHIAKQRIMSEVDASSGALTSEKVMDLRADSLAAVDPEMKYLMKEYHDGLLLYEISKQVVWDKGSSDEAGLQAYFKDHQKDYAWSEPHYKGIAYHVKDKADIKAVKKCVKKLPFDQWADKLRSTFNPDSVVRIRVEIGIFKPGDNALVDTEVFKTTPKKGANEKQTAVLKDYPFSAVYGKKLKRPEDYTDVRGQVVSDYQDMLEKAWVYDLRKKYAFSVNKEVLKTVNKH
ncbi:MAG: peptidylprolyl isomerase [Prevotella sp.]|nr:peptidylprolyl isomerase [Prevotella sp.]MBO7538303.1 peptidylprolyl isomerase [Prevotella sp.]